MNDTDHTIRVYMRYSMSQEDRKTTQWDSEQQEIGAEVQWSNQDNATDNIFVGESRGNNLDWYLIEDTWEKQ